MRRIFVTIGTWLGVVLALMVIVKFIHLLPSLALTVIGILVVVVVSWIVYDFYRPRS